MIREDINLSKLLFHLADTHPEMEALTQSLSIATFRYIPADLLQFQGREEYLDSLNKTLLDELQAGGEVFLSNAVVNEHYCLRACIVNFRTSRDDIEEIVEIIVREGRRIHNSMAPS